jgi:hypothetical protein
VSDPFKLPQNQRDRNIVPANRVPPSLSKHLLLPVQWHQIWAVRQGHASNEITAVMVKLRSGRDRWDEDYENLVAQPRQGDSDRTFLEGRAWIRTGIALVWVR